MLSFEKTIEFSNQLKKYKKNWFPLSPIVSQLLNKTV